MSISITLTQEVGFAISEDVDAGADRPGEMNRAAHS